MKTSETKGLICVKDEYGLTYNLCSITYILKEDESFKYIFEPNYSVISLLNSKVFQGIPGLNLDLKMKEYVRENKIPTFISERVPSEKREDYFDLLKEVDMDYMNPIIYLQRIKKQYSGDKYFVISYNAKTIVSINEKYKNNNSFIRTKHILENICLGNDLKINNQTIDDNNRKMFYDVLIEGYIKSYLFNKEKQREGIKRAKQQHKYKGRKPISVDRLMFEELLEKVQKKEMRPKEVADKLGISIDKYYRYKKNLQK